MAEILAIRRKTLSINQSTSKQIGYFVVPHLLWHSFKMIISVHVTVTTVVDCLAVELSLPVLTTKICQVWDLNTRSSVCEANALTNCSSTAAIDNVITIKSILINIAMSTISMEYRSDYIYHTMSDLFFLKLLPKKSYAARCLEGKCHLDEDCLYNFSEM